MGLFLRRPSGSTGNAKSTGQQQNGNKPQLLPLREFPEGQKEFSSQLEVTKLRTNMDKLCEMERSTYWSQSTADCRTKARHKLRIRILNDLRRNTTLICNEPLHPISSGLHPFVQLLIPFKSPL